MFLEQFKPTKKNGFEITSGRLLIADPFNLGYSKNTEDKVDNARNSATTKNPVITFPHGILYYTLSKDGSGVDCTMGVYHEGGSIKIIRNDNLTNIEDIKKEFEEFEEDYENFDSFLREYLYSDSRVVDAQSYHKLNKPLFDVSVDLCSLLIGDAERFSLPESKWTVGDSSHIPPERRETYEEGRKGLIRDSYEKQILQIPNGLYTAEHVLQEETLILKPLKR